MARLAAPHQEDHPVDDDDEDEDMKLAVSPAGSREAEDTVDVVSQATEARSPVSQSPLALTQKETAEETSEQEGKPFADFSDHVLGGKSEKPAFCLLDGFVQGAKEEGGLKPFRLAIDRLPATLGRTHVSKEANFFGLGKVKALSRHQCRIDYRVPSGTIGQFQASNEFTYQAQPAEKSKVSNPPDAEVTEHGAYVITCLGKNSVKVNGVKVDQNETCLLPHGSTVKLSAFSLYFLLPPKPSKKTMEIPLLKKRKREAELVVSNSPTAKKSKIPAFKTMQEELENMSTEDLLAQLETADEKDIWDRRCQFMGATVSYRAVYEAAQSDELKTSQATASAQAPGISKQEVVQWIQDSAKYGHWAEIMQRKLEPKSYQTNIAKAMQRAGYERSTSVSVGRHVRWYLPPNLDAKPWNGSTNASTAAAAPEKKVGKEAVKKEGSEENDPSSDTQPGGDEDNAAGGSNDETERPDEDQEVGSAEE
jgi:hypothetical protein